MESKQAAGSEPATIQSQYDINVLIVGCTDCGKSTFISSLLSGLKASITDDGSFLLQNPRSAIHLHILENDLVQFQQSVFPTCVLLCYNTSDAESLATLRNYWYKQVLLSKPAETDTIPMMLLGLQRDLKLHSPSGAVDIHEALAEGRQMRASRYGECSAKTGDMMKLVAEDFVNMLKECLTRHQDSYSYCVVS